MKPYQMIVVFTVLFSLCVPTSAKSDDQVAPNENALFRGEAPLQFKLESPFSNLFSQIDLKDMVHSRKLTAAGLLTVGNKSFRVKIGLRGYSTLQHCKFPKLSLEWKKSDAEGTPFAGLKKINLGTHCVSTEEFSAIKDWTKVYAQGMQFPFRENLIYQWARILNIPSFATRRAIVNYVDTSSSHSIPAFTRAAILVENSSSLQKRANALEILPENDPLNPGDENDDGVKRAWKSPEDATAQIDWRRLAQTILFQSLIGNVDWRIGSNLPWNVKIFEMPSRKWLILPVDFNLSTIALGWKPETILWTHKDFKYFSMASKHERLEAISAFEAKKQLLIEAVNSLGDDSEGKRIVLDTIEAKFSDFAKEKATIEKE